MPENGHLNGSQNGVERVFFVDSENGIPRFPDFGLCRGRGGRNPTQQNTRKIDNR